MKGLQEFFPHCLDYCTSLSKVWLCCIMRGVYRFAREVQAITEIREADVQRSR
jgi:hypothetical protein